jgi:hypothetical protein
MLCRGDAVVTVERVKSTIDFVGQAATQLPRTVHLAKSILERLSAIFGAPVGHALTHFPHPMQPAEQ